MKILLSPAKTLDYESVLPTTKHSEASFLDITQKVNTKLSKLSKKKLGELMHISPKLADLNHQRYLDFQPEHTTENSRPAIYAFAGDVYVGLEAYTIPTEKLDQLQDKLRILSGFYGILKPMDLIQPYRLEMGTRLATPAGGNLYQFWGARIAEYLNQRLAADASPVIGARSFLSCTASTDWIGTTCVISSSVSSIFSGSPPTRTGR